MTKQIGGDEKLKTLKRTTEGLIELSWDFYWMKIWSAKDNPIA